MQVIRQNRTAIKIGYSETVATAGEGTDTEFILVKVPIGTSIEGETVTTETFYCEWSNSYGYMAIAQAEEGVSQPARIRMPYVPEVLDILNNKDVRIYKGGIVDDDHAFVLNSTVDNYLEQSKMIEFYVKKYTEK